jgi:hypothetical protein
MQSVDDLLRKYLKRTMSNANNEQYHGGEVLTRRRSLLCLLPFGDWTG